MNNNKTQKYISRLTIILIFSLLALNIKNIFIKLEYIFLFVDERQLIDDIYNVFFFNDEFERFANVSNSFIKKTLILFSEIIIGGNLDYGRLWNNMFVFICAPFFFFSDSLPIIIERLLLVLIVYFSLFYFSRHFVIKKYQSLFVLFSLGAPGIFYVLNPPKPDALVLLVLFIAIKFLFKDENYNRGFIFLGISIGIKLSSLLPAFLLAAYLIYPLNKINDIKKAIRAILYTILGIIIAQPAIIIPYPPITRRIISQVKAAIFYDQESVNSSLFESIDNWIFSLEDIFSINRYILIFFYFFLVFELFINLYKKTNLKESYFLLFFCSSVMFHTVLITRVWTYYLMIPFVFLGCYFFLTLPNKKSKVSKLTLSFYLILSLSGLFTNISNQINYGFEENKAWTSNLYESLDFIENMYINLDSPYNLVYWDPDYYFPKQKITYDAKFKVLENWDNDQELNPLRDKVDFIVTREEFSTGINYSKKSIGDLNIYFLKDK